MELRIESFSSSGNHLKWLENSLKHANEHGNKWTDPHDEKSKYYYRLFKSITDTRSADILVPDSTRSFRKISKKDRLKHFRDLEIEKLLDSKNRLEYSEKVKALETELEFMMKDIKERSARGDPVEFSSQFFVRVALDSFRSNLRRTFDSNGATNMLRENLIKLYGNNFEDILLPALVQKWFKLHTSQMKSQAVTANKLITERMLSVFDEVSEWLEEHYNEPISIAFDGEPVELVIRDDGGVGVSAKMVPKKDWIRYDTPTSSFRDLGSLTEHYSMTNGKPIGSGEGSLNSMVPRQNPPPKSSPARMPPKPVRVRTGLSVKPKQPGGDIRKLFKPQSPPEDPELDSASSGIEDEAIQETLMSEGTYVVPGPSVVKPEEHREALRGGYSHQRTVRGGMVTPQ
jgi:hypothetical protein